MVADRFKKFQDYESTKPKEASKSIFKVALAIWSVISGYRIMVDFYTDVYVTYLIYNANSNAKEGDDNNYLVALAISFISLIAPFMITQSGIVTLKFVQREFEE